MLQKLNSFHVKIKTRETVILHNSSDLFCIYLEYRSCFINEPFYVFLRHFSVVYNLTNYESIFLFNLTIYLSIYLIFFHIYHLYFLGIFILISTYIFLYLTYLCINISSYIPTCLSIWYINSSLSRVIKMYLFCSLAPRILMERVGVQTVL